MNQPVQLLGISNAIVDVLTHVDADFLARIGAAPGSMTLIDRDAAVGLYDSMGPATEMSGGSVANTVAGFANLGGSAAYIGKVRNDQLGDIFNHDMASLGVDIRLVPAADGAPTARSMILITEDGQRTMQTYLGACTELALADIRPETIGAAQMTLLEGYVWDIAEGPALAERAAELTAANGGRVALSLSDSLCVGRHLESFRDFVARHADIVVADEEEVYALLGNDDIDAVVRELGRRGGIFAVTRSEKGSVVVDGDTVVEQAALPIDKLVDTTGAGDAYAAGFLYGLASGESLADCARFGTHCATRVIQQVGARLDRAPQAMR